MKIVDKKSLRTWIEIDKKALKHNYDIFRHLIPSDCKLLSVVKSNAYGHGIIDFSREISRLGGDWLGVDSIVEARALREAGIKTSILVLGYTIPSLYKDAFNSDVSLTVSSFDSLSQVAKTNTVKKKIHIKVDTGMHRQGFLSDDLRKVISFLKAHKLSVEGLYTHFADAKNPSFPSRTSEQIKEFEKWIEAFKVAGFNPIVHASATSGTLVFPKAHFDMVRIGIGMYGLWPSQEVQSFCESRFELKPIMSWKTIISEVKHIKAGSKIGYDYTETLERPTQVAICPIGYWHGFPRALSSIGNVLVNGKKCRVLGRVSMDMISIDVQGVKNLKSGTEVTVIGKSGKEILSADYLASLTQTSNYELVTRINPLIKRFYI